MSDIEEGNIEEEPEVMDDEDKVRSRFGHESGSESESEPAVTDAAADSAPDESKLYVGNLPISVSSTACIMQSASPSPHCIATATAELPFVTV